MSRRSAAQQAIERALANATPPPDVVEAEIVEDMPPRRELILTGRAALADLARNPDDWVDADTDRELIEGIPKNTRAAIEWGWGRFVWWCGQRGRQHMPATPATMRQYIKEHWDMTRTLPSGQVVKRGRYGQPYAPDTVELAVYIVSMVHQWKGYPSPTRHPFVHKQLKVYRDKFEAANFRPDVPDAMTHEHNVAMARACNLGTAGGLRDATMLRLQFDTGARASEICHIQHQDVRWLSDDQVEITISRAKAGGAAGARKVGVEAVRDVDWDVDPARLLRRLMDFQAGQGITSGPVFRQARNGPARKDFAETGIVAGRYTDVELVYGDYDVAFKKALAASGVDRDAAGRRVLHYTTHSNRAGHITEAVDEDVPSEVVSQRTGHSPGSDSFRRYYRSGRRFGKHNSGAAIRRAKRRPVDGGREA
jgi:integrase